MYWTFKKTCNGILCLSSMWIESKYSTGTYDLFITTCILLLFLNTILFFYEQRKFTNGIWFQFGYKKFAWNILIAHLIIGSVFLLISFISQNVFSAYLVLPVFANGIMLTRDFKLIITDKTVIWRKEINVVPIRKTRIKDAIIDYEKVAVSTKRKLYKCLWTEILPEEVNILKAKISQIDQDAKSAKYRKV